MLVLDLDGTLLRPDKTIGSRTLDALRQASARGLQVALNSGRMIPSMDRIAALLGFDVFLIGYNGAGVADLRAAGRRKIFERPLDPAVAREIVELAAARHLQLNYYRDELVFSEQHADLRRFVDLYQARTRSPYHYIACLAEALEVPPLKLLIVTEPSRRDALYAELAPRWKARAQLLKTDPEYLEFIHPEVDKAVGLKHLCAALGIGLENVLALGDADNDAPMLAAAGWGVALANASAASRAVAAAVTENDCENDGVAEALERWVL